MGQPATLILRTPPTLLIPVARLWTTTRQMAPMDLTRTHQLRTIPIQQMQAICPMLTTTTPTGPILTHILPIVQAMEVCQITAVIHLILSRTLQTPLAMEVCRIMVLIPRIHIPIPRTAREMAVCP